MRINSVKWHGGTSVAFKFSWIEKYLVHCKKPIFRRCIVFSTCVIYVAKNLTWNRPFLSMFLWIVFKCITGLCVTEISVKLFKYHQNAKVKLSTALFYIWCHFLQSSFISLGTNEIYFFVVTSYFGFFLSKCRLLYFFMPHGLDLHSNRSEAATVGFSHTSVGQLSDFRKTNGSFYNEKKNSETSPPPFKILIFLARKLKRKIDNSRLLDFLNL